MDIDWMNVKCCAKTLQMKMNKEKEEEKLANFAKPYYTLLRPFALKFSHRSPLFLFTWDVICAAKSR